MAGSFRFRWVAISCRLLAVLAVLADGHHGEGKSQKSKHPTTNIERPTSNVKGGGVAREGGGKGLPLEEGEHAGADEGGGEAAEACLRVHVVTLGFHAGGAGEVEAEAVFELTVGAGAAGFGGAEEADDGLAQGGGGVHGAGVVGDHEVAAAEPLDHFGQGGDAAEIDALSGRGEGDGGAEFAVVFAAEDGETDAG